MDLVHQYQIQTINKHLNTITPALCWQG